MAGGQARLLLLLLLALLQQFAAGASDLEAFPPSPWNREASLPRKWMKETAAAAPFCGSEAGSCCCSVADEQKLREAFLAEVKAHGYRDAECRSELKAYICAECLRPSNTSTTTMNSTSLPLRCAGAATVTLNSFSMAPTAQPPTPEAQIRPPRNTNNAPKKPKWLTPLIAVLAVLFGGGGGYVAYKICNKQNFQCCNNNQIQCCLWLWRGSGSASVENRGSELVREAELVGEVPPGRRQPE